MALILVVEDDDPVRELFARVLTRAGFEVDVASDGHEAVKAFETGCYPVMVTDLVMPRKEGLETIMEIKQRWPECKIIAVSGGGRLVNSDVLELALHIGADAVLRKPVSAAQLLAAVRRAIGLENAAA